MPGQDSLRFQQLVDYLHRLRVMDTAVPLCEIPELLRPDLLEFIAGETLTCAKTGR